MPESVAAEVARPAHDTPAQSHEPPGTQPSASRGRGTFFTWFLAALLVAIPLVAAVQLARHDPFVLEPSPVSDEQTLAAVNDTTGRVYTIGADQQVTQTTAGGDRVRERPVDSDPLSVATTAEDRAIIGYSDGTVVSVDPSLTVQARVPLTGRVTSVARLSDGTVVAAHGSGQFARRFTLSFIDATTLSIEDKVQIPGTVTASVAGPDGALLVGTSVGGVSVVNPERQVSCTAQVNAQVTTATAAAGRYYVGDARGTAYAFTDDCQLLWQAQVTPGQVRAAQPLADGSVLLGDDVGELVHLDVAGVEVARAQVADSSIRAILPRGAVDAFVVVQQSGTRTDLSLADSRGTVNATVLWLSVAAAELLLGAAVLWRIRRRHDRLHAAMRRTTTQIVRGRLGYLYILPVLSLIALFFYYPVLLAAGTSLTDRNLSSQRTNWVGLDNYGEVIFHDQYFHRGLLNVFIILAVSLLKTLTVPLLCAELVYWLRSHRQRRLLRTLLVIPAVVPELVVVLLWKTIYQPEGGLLNAVLEAIGLGSLQQVWLGDARFALAALLFVGFPFLSAFPFLILYGGLLEIDRNIFEAAAVDGVSVWQRFRHIDLPFLRPQLAIVTLFATIGAVQGFASVFVLTRGGPGLSTYVPALEMYQRIGQGELGYASTIGMVLALVVALVVLAARWRPGRTKS